MTALAHWQDAFAAALRDDSAAPPFYAAEPGFRVYRNTVWRGWIEAVVANYPAVARLVGADWIEQAARAFVRLSPPASPVLALYGEGFPAFLSTFGPAAELPYLAQVARLDRAWTTAHAAAEGPRLASDMAARLSSGDMAKLCARPHPSLSAFWFDETIPTLWLANRDDFEGGELVLVDRPEGLLIARPGAVVEAMPLDAAGFAFLQACASGRSLLGAASTAISADPAVDLGGLFARLLAFGAFTRLNPVARSLQ